MDKIRVRGDIFNCEVVCPSHTVNSTILCFDCIQHKNVNNRKYRYKPQYRVQNGTSCDNCDAVNYPLYEFLKRDNPKLEFEILDPKGLAQWQRTANTQNAN